MPLSAHAIQCHPASYYSSVGRRLSSDHRALTTPSRNHPARPIQLAIPAAQLACKHIACRPPAAHPAPHLQRLTERPLTQPANNLASRRQTSLKAPRRASPRTPQNNHKPTTHPQCNRHTPRPARATQWQSHSIPTSPPRAQSSTTSRTPPNGPTQSSITERRLRRIRQQVQR